MPLGGDYQNISPGAQKNAVDRNNEKLANLYNWNHPAVKKAVKTAIEVCKENRIHTSICGQAGSDPKFVPFLIECGIDSVSANPDAVAEIKKLVYVTEKKLLIDAASSQEIESPQA